MVRFLIPLFLVSLVFAEDVKQSQQKTYLEVPSLLVIKRPTGWTWEKDENPPPEAKIDEFYVCKKAGKKRRGIPVISLQIRKFSLEQLRRAGGADSLVKGTMDAFENTFNQHMEGEEKEVLFHSNEIIKKPHRVTQKAFFTTVKNSKMHLHYNFMHKSKLITVSCVTKDKSDLALMTDVVETIILSR